MIQTITEAHALLKQVYSYEFLSHTQVFEWFKQLKEKWEEIEDDRRPGQPSTSTTGDNVEKIGILVRKDRWLSICKIAEILEINKEFRRYNMRIWKCKKFV